MKIYRNDLTSASFLNVYWDVLRRAATPRRLANAVLTGIDYILAREVPYSLPILAKFEVSNQCNLRCPLCRHGDDPKLEVFRTKRNMNLETFRSCLDQVGPQIFLAYLYHGGESFLNREVLSFCELATSRDIATAISSNFSLRFSDEFMDRIVTSGLSYLTVSMDGVSQSIYEKYRIGGNAQLVQDNIRRLVAAKRRHGSKTPILAWQYIIFDHNRHELDDAITLGRELEVDQLIIMRNIQALFDDGTQTIGSGSTSTLLDQPFPFKCKWLWSTPIFLADGSVVPCCNYDWNRKNAMVPPPAQEFRAIWTGTDYGLNRRIVSRRVTAKDHPTAFCAACPLKEKDF